VFKRVRKPNVKVDDAHHGLNVIFKNYRRISMSDWFPQSISKGPPLPRWLNIFWPWYQESPVPTDLANLTGVVMDNAGLIPDANVQIGNISAKSNAVGIYAFDGLPPGPVAMKATALGYQDVTLSVVLIRGANVRDITMSKEVVQVQTATLAGKVLGNGVAVSGVLVKVLGSEVRTGSDGQFRIENLTPGFAPVSAEATGYQLYSAMRELARGENYVEITLTPVALRQGFAITLVSSNPNATKWQASFQGRSSPMLAKSAPWQDSTLLKTETGTLKVDIYV